MQNRERKIFRFKGREKNFLNDVVLFSCLNINWNS